MKPEMEIGRNERIAQRVLQAVEWSRRAEFWWFVTMILKKNFL